MRSFDPKAQLLHNHILWKWDKNTALSPKCYAGGFLNNFSFASKLEHFIDVNYKHTHSLVKLHVEKEDGHTGIAEICDFKHLNYRIYFLCSKFYCHQGNLLIILIPTNLATEGKQAGWRDVNYRSLSQLKHIYFLYIL